MRLPVRPNDRGKTHRLTIFATVWQISLSVLPDAQKVCHHTLTTTETLLPPIEINTSQNQPSLCAHQPQTLQSNPPTSHQPQHFASTPPRSWLILHHDPPLSPQMASLSISLPTFWHALLSPNQLLATAGNSHLW